MSLLSQFSQHFWLMFYIAVLRELRRPDDDALRKKRERS